MRLQHWHSVYACRATLIRAALEPHPLQQVQPVKHSILIAALLCLLMGAFARAETYQLVTEEWAPYNYRENEHITGMATEVVRAIMALTGDHFEIRMRPSMRASRVLQTQPRTIMYSMFRTPERESLFKWVGPIAEESIYPYQLAAAAQPIHTLEQLLHAPRITTRHAGLVPTMLASMGFDNLDMSATESRQLYRMLLAGRTEVIIGDTDAGVAYYSRQLGIAPGTLKRVPIELYRSSLYIAFSCDSDDDLVANWARALEHLRDTGELARIQSHYR
ncbi:polar amino acid transport system substrate-binding protein [Pseudomonas sp. NFACC19-2]|nr:polar amino acid transport system substrate-binding protein [Pseudomonas sp. NFACC19-2]